MVLLSALSAILALTGTAVAAPRPVREVVLASGPAVGDLEQPSSASSSFAYWTSPLGSLFGPAKPHPVVVWHGLGDSAEAKGMLSFKESLEEAFPGIYVHLVALGSEGSDRNRGFFGNVNEDSLQVCETLAAIPELKGGFDAVGFSQGGQFLRALVQRCPEVKVRNLVTFGSQHQGIADFPACSSADLLCRAAEAALKSGIYSDWAQTHVVTAQYFRRPVRYDEYQQYLAANHFLTDINNELQQNDEYKKRLSSLDTFVMLQFDEDVTVVPKRSSWFESYPVGRPDHDDDDDVVEGMGKNPELETVPLRQSDIYLQDKLGLKALDSRGSLVLDVCRGAHMQIDAACQLKVFGKYVGTPSSSRLVPDAVRHGWARVLYGTSGLRATSLPWSIDVALFCFYAVVFSWVVRLGALLYSSFARPHLRRWSSSRKTGTIRLG